ncbi:hypothetical protein FGO68_gene14797 [Halteria grandinella]|uniref:Uncharacterized protein n=1 Tax=Halteria grandinella TaxID=5974 RepID=A0A8J8NY33_HALGN|nr:hypothetical protein FGO68_gene14797 [Halteria grandinella]
MLKKNSTISSEAPIKQKLFHIQRQFKDNAPDMATISVLRKVERFGRTTNLDIIHSQHDGEEEEDIAKNNQQCCKMKHHAKIRQIQSSSEGLKPLQAPRNNLRVEKEVEAIFEDDESDEFDKFERKNLPLSMPSLKLQTAKSSMYDLPLQRKKQQTSLYLDQAIPFLNHLQHAKGRTSLDNLWDQMEQAYQDGSEAYVEAAPPLEEQSGNFIYRQPNLVGLKVKLEQACPDSGGFASGMLSELPAQLMMASSIGNLEDETDCCYLTTEFNEKITLPSFNMGIKEQYLQQQQNASPQIKNTQQKHIYEELRLNVIEAELQQRQTAKIFTKQFNNPLSMKGRIFDEQQA